MTGDGITEAFDWLALQLGSSQVKQTAEINKIQTEVTHFLPPQNHPETCERSYSALACFFIRPTQAVGIHKDDDKLNHDGDDEKIDDV